MSYADKFLEVGNGRWIPISLRVPATMKNSGLILASASPRRIGLLQDLGLPFTVEPSRFVEQHPDRPLRPGRLVETLAFGKAREVADRIGAGLVVGADTVVMLGRRILEKPCDPAEARDMLSRLSGRWHEVFTGMAIIDVRIGRHLLGHERTRVKFRRLSASEISAYVATGEPMDKAGAYGIQGLGAIFVERIDGCYTNVVGLPLVRLVRMLRRFGLAVLDDSV